MQVRYYGRALELSRYEYGLLKTLASGPAMSSRATTLLDRVWDDDSDSMDRTVDAHVKTLRAKMKAIAPEARADPHAARQRLCARRGPAADRFVTAAALRVRRREGPIDQAHPHLHRHPASPTRSASPS